MGVSEGLECNSCQSTWWGLDSGPGGSRYDHRLGGALTRLSASVSDQAQRLLFAELSQAILCTSPTPIFSSQS